MPKYIIGVDLGTTNTVLSYIDSQTGNAPTILPIPQFTDAETIESLNYLPSFIYLGLTNEVYRLPWGQNNPNFVVGSYARKRSTQAPDRTIAASKSWLSHQGIDRRKGLLPTNAAEDITKISAVTAAELILTHVKNAWDAQFPNAPFIEQQIVLTIPASFDASARDLTREASLNVGYPPSMTILEEPQAALYAWLATKKESWRKDLVVGDRILVIDVGGGTADFSLIEITNENNNLSLNRKAVGKHLLVGGDNMDLALAFYAASKLEEQGHSIDAWQNTALWHTCRQAKETLLSINDQQTFKITIAGRGKKLIGGSLSVELNKEDIKKLLLEGFFPICDYQTSIQKGRSGFQETGLPYETEAAITKHLANFVNNNLANSNSKINYILFNGGVFKAEYFQKRILETITHWFKETPKLLDQNADLDCAVAKGAAYYGFARISGGIRIKGGTSRSYYLGFESSGMAIPGMPRPMHALCIVPKGLEEGQEFEVPANNLALMAGEASRFPFFSSNQREVDKPGEILKPIKNYALEESVNITANIHSNKHQPGEMIPIKIKVCLLETGSLEIVAVSREYQDQWKFEFNARE